MACIYPLRLHYGFFLHIAVGFAALCHYHPHSYSLSSLIVDSRRLTLTLHMFNHDALGLVPKGVSRSRFIVSDIASSPLLPNLDCWHWICLVSPDSRSRHYCPFQSPSPISPFPSSYQSHCIVIVYRYRIAKISRWTLFFCTLPPLHPTPCPLLLCTCTVVAHLVALVFDCPSMLTPLASWVLFRSRLFCPILLTSTVVLLVFLLVSLFVDRRLWAN